MRERDDLYKNDPEAVIARHFTLTVDRVFRGTAEKTIGIYEPNDSGRASFRWKVGIKYLLFLVNSSEGSGLSLDGCGNSSPLAKAGSALREIDQARVHNPTALIMGMVSTVHLEAPMPGIDVVARGSGATYKASTDRMGRFRIEVPPGDYMVEPVQPPLSFKVDELSYENPQNLKMQAGNCAQVQFTAASEKDSLQWLNH
jgi:hypothetical protein